jgi:hypothetical protein
MFDFFPFWILMKLKKPQDRGFDIRLGLIIRLPVTFDLFDHLFQGLNDDI